MADPYEANVSLLLPFLGADQGTVFTDYSPSPNTLTRYGDVKTVTAQSKYYGSSGYFDGNGDYLAANSVSAPISAVSAFTIEGWFYRESGATGQETLFGFHTSAGENKLVFTNSQIFGSVFGTISPPALPLNTWFHYAVVRTATRVVVYLNGVEFVSLTASSNDILSSDLFSIGQDYDSGPTATDFWKGFIQDFRVTAGIARYTANFTPPTALISLLSVSGTITDAAGAPLANTPVRLYRRDTGALLGSTLTGDGSAEVPGDEHYNSVSLLLHMNGADQSTTFTDNSPAPKTVTRYGDTKIVTAESKFNGSSAYFDGSGDALVATDTLGSGDFTLEGWARTSDMAKTFIPFEARNADFDEDGLLFYFRSSFRLTIGGGSPFVATEGTTPLSNNVWYHIALCRSGNTLTGYLNGVLELTRAWSASLTRPITIGLQYNRPSGLAPGFMQDVRLTKGVVRYTANFTPPTAPYPDNLLIPAKPLGEYTIPTTYADEVQRIVLAPDGATLYNDIIDRVIPG